jgi:hypothetical protein
VVIGVWPLRLNRCAGPRYRLLRVQEQTKR